MSLNNPVAASVATLLLNNGKLLLGKRFKSNRFEGWQCPGGYLLQGETVEQASKRHCLEKAGLEIRDIRQGPYTNNLFSIPSPVLHTVTLYVIARQHQVINSQLFNDAQLNWSWYEIENLPEGLFLPLKILTEKYQLIQLIRG